jgi:photosystem II stability/assembly factor-like uncharacterized protein
MMSLKPATSMSTLAAAVVSGAALLAAGCGTASSSHPAGAFNGQPSLSRPSGPATSAPASASPSSSAGAQSRSSSSSSLCTGPAGAAAYAAPGVQVQVPPLDAVQFVSPAKGWVAGAGHILATSNGGQTWTQQYSGPAKLDQVDFTDAQHGWAVGISSLLGTTNGGATWTALDDPCGSIRSVHFITSDLGIAVAGGSQVRVDGGVPAPAVGGELLVTTDGGRYWQAAPGAPALAQSACFASAADGFVGTPGKVWRTSDGGLHWTLMFTEPAVSAAGMKPESADTTVLECAGDTAAWVLFLGSGAAMSHAPYLAYDTQNAHTMHALFEEAYIETAIRPQVHAPEGPGSYPGPFSAISPDTAVFVGYTPPVGYGVAPVMMVTGDTHLTLDGNVGGINQAYGVAFVSTTVGWVVGGNEQTGVYSIEATADGGHTWTSQYQVR